MSLKLRFTRLALCARGAKTGFGRFGFMKAKLAIGRRRPCASLVRLLLLVGFGLFSIQSYAAPIYSGWSPPVNVGPLVNSEHNDTLPVISENGLSLYFSSNRPGPIQGPAHFDIWVSQRARVRNADGRPIPRATSRPRRGSGSRSATRSRTRSPAPPPRTPPPRRAAAAPPRCAGGRSTAWA